MSSPPDTTETVRFPRMNPARRVLLAGLENNVRTAWTHYRNMRMRLMVPLMVTLVSVLSLVFFTIYLWHGLYLDRAVSYSDDALTTACVVEDYRLEEEDDGGYG